MDNTEHVNQYRKTDPYNNNGDNQSTQDLESSKTIDLSALADEAAWAPDLVKAATSQIAFAATNDEQKTRYDAGNKYPDAPFAYRPKDNEKIYTNSGHMVYESLEASIPGVNNLNLDIVLRFDSSKANLNEVYGESWLAWRYRLHVETVISHENKITKEHIFGEPIPRYLDDATEETLKNYLQSEKESPEKIGSDSLYNYHRWTLIKSVKEYQVEEHKNLLRESTHEQNNNLGFGWSFGFSRLEINEHKDTSEYVWEKKDPTIYLHTGDGGTYKVKFPLKDGESNLEKHETKDLCLQKDSSGFSNGQYNSAYVLNFKDGKQEYFDSDGRLLGIQDRFENKIIFQYMGNERFFRKIILAGNREVNVQYTDTEITIYLPDGKRIRYEREQIPDNPGKYFLRRRYDQLDRRTEFNYKPGRVECNIFERSFNKTSPVTLTYALLDQVKYPTGATTTYTYNAKTCNLDYRGLTQRNVLTSRCEWDASGKYNHQTFTYSDEDYTGYPNNPNPDYLPEGYEYFTRITDVYEKDNDKNGQYKHIQYNSKHMPLYEKVCKANGDMLSHTSYTYNEHRLPTRKETILQETGGRQTSITCSQYNEYGDVTATWGPLANGDTGNTEHKTQISYHQNYHYVTEMTYKTDPSTSVREVYEPTATASDNGRTIARKKVFQTVNNQEVQKAETAYEYDTYGNLIKQTEYARVAPLDDPIITVFEYSPFGIHLIKSTRIDVTNAYDNLVEGSPGARAGEITQTFAYDTMGRPTHQSDGRGSVTQIQYDALGRKIKQIAPNGSAFHWHYDDASNTLTETNELGKILKHQYSGLGLALSTSDMNPSTTNLNQSATLRSCTYDEKMRLISETVLPDSPNEGAVSIRSYDPLGRVLTEESKSKAGDLLAKTTYDYNITPDGLLMEEKVVVGDANSPSMTSRKYTNHAGQTVKTSRFKNSIELFDLHFFNYVGKETALQTAHTLANYPGTYTARREYDYAGQLTREYDASGRYVTTEYDALGRAIHKKDFNANAYGKGQSVIMKYDQMGRLIRESTRFEGIYFAQSEYFYDQNGNVTGQQQRNSKPGQDLSWSSTVNSYDSMGFLTHVKMLDKNGKAESEVKYTHDAAGNITSQCIAPNTSFEGRMGKQTDYEYDKSGNLEVERDPLGQVKTYAYDVLGNQISMKDRNGSIYTSLYDGLSRLVSLTITNGAQSTTKLTSYTLTGLPSEIGEGDFTTRYSYDDLGQVVCEIETADNRPTITRGYAYDLAGNKISMTLDSDSTRMQSLTYQYDQNGRLTSFANNGQQVASHAYDPNGNRIQTNYANGTSQICTFNDANLVTSLENRVNGVVVHGETNEYNLLGSICRKTETGGKIAQYTYDELNRLTQEAENYGARRIVKRYYFDAWGNRSGMTTVEPGKKKLTSYRYDRNNRLLEERTEELPGPLPTNTDAFGGYGKMLYNRRPSWAYDNEETEKLLSQDWAYNRLPYNRSGATNADGDESVKTKVLYGYDANGSQISQASYRKKDYYWILTEEIDNAYDLQNRLTGFDKRCGDENLAPVLTGTGAYAYRPDGMRILKTYKNHETNEETTCKHVWDGTNIVAELDAGNVAFAQYLYGRTLTAVEDAQGVRQYFQRNTHGDVIALCAADGATIRRYEYDAFGNQIGTDEDDRNPWRYCGEYLDLSSKMYYLRARYYNPENASFLSEDSVKSVSREMPNGQKIPHPLGSNYYTYCAGNPIFYRDDSGNFFILAALAVGLVAGAAVGALYSHITYGEIHWQNVAIGALIGGVAGLVVGAAGALIFGGAITASTAQVGAGLVAMFSSQAPMIIKGIGSVWAKGATARGQLIEKALGGMNNNFPVIDKFVRRADGLAASMTSIKSIDIFAKSYQKANAIYNTIMRYGNQLYEFKGQDWGGTRIWATEGTMKFLELAIPRGANAEQLLQIRQATIELAKRGIQVVTHVFR